MSISKTKKKALCLFFRYNRPWIQLPQSKLFFDLSSNWRKKGFLLKYPSQPKDISRLVHQYFLLCFSFFLCVVFLCFLSDPSLLEQTTSDMTSPKLRQVFSIPFFSRIFKLCKFFFFECGFRMCNASPLANYFFMPCKKLFTDRHDSCQALS